MLSFPALTPIFIAVTLAGCGDKAPTSAPLTAPPPAASPSPSRADASTPSARATPEGAAIADTRSWAGRWLGPEGTSLNLIAQNDGNYQVAIRNLDGERSFAGQATASGIAFERDGARETIRATDGDATGMKWLAGKKICLMVRAGEGYCRD